MLKSFVLVFLILFGFHFSFSQEKIYLWPEGAPFAMGVAEEDKPSITAYFPAKDKATGAAVIICPGGGYVTLATSHEGDSVAQWFNKLGIVAFVLRYRVGTWDHKKYQHPVPFMDATRAMRLVRSRAKEWNLNPEKIGIMGFSAGGHLASTVATRFDGGNPKSKNIIDKQSSKPNFLVLVYPVITLNTKYAFRFGRGVLLGENASQASIDSLSTETQVTSLTPPTFLMHSNDDGVHPENSVLFYMALREANVPAELHIYERGGHGYGLGKDPITSTWTDRLKDWLKNQGLLK